MWPTEAFKPAFLVTYPLCHPTYLICKSLAVLQTRSRRVMSSFRKKEKTTSTELIFSGRKVSRRRILSIPSAMQWFAKSHLKLLWVWSLHISNLHGASEMKNWKEKVKKNHTFFMLRNKTPRNVFLSECGICCPQTQKVILKTSVATLMSPLKIEIF